MTEPRRLTLGMPVFNGERFLEETLDSIASQTFGDYELIVSDNASTDGTAQILAEYSSRDPRIRVVRQETNLGATRNHNVVVELATTPLFKWVASDDLIAPTFLERCIDVLDQRPDVIACHTRVMRIDEGSRLIRAEKGIKTNSQRPHVRFRNVIARQHSCFSIFGVIRTDILERTGLIRGHIGADRTLLAELALLGPSVEVPEILLFRRMHAGSYSSGRRLSHADNLAWWRGHAAESAPGDHDAEASTASIYLGLVRESELGDAERRRCNLEVQVSHRAAGLGHRIKRRLLWPVWRVYRQARARLLSFQGRTPPPAATWAEHVEGANEP